MQGYETNIPKSESSKNNLLDPTSSSNQFDIDKLKQKFQLHYQSWQKLAFERKALVAAIIIACFLIFSGGVFALGDYLSNNQTAIDSENTPQTDEASPSPESSPSPTPTVSPLLSTSPVTTTASVTTNSTTDTTTTQTTQTTISPSPSPTATSAPASYVLNRSRSSVTMTVSEPNSGYAIYALLKNDGKVVTNQSNIRYQWSINNSSVASLEPFTACIEGIQPPCPEDHVNIFGKAEGSATITAKAYWKDSGQLIDDVTFSLTVEASNEPPKMKITYPTSGQDISFSSSSQQFCVVDVPNGGDNNGLQRKQNTGSGWSSYQNHSTLCYTPNQGSNTLQLQYKNGAGVESEVYSVSFTFSSP